VGRTLRPRTDGRRVIRSLARGATALLLLTLASPTAAGLAFLALAPSASTAQTPAIVRWAAGEFLEYDVKVGMLTAGSARMEVLPSDTIRGHTAWRLRFNVTGGFWPIRVNDWYDSWMDVGSLSSLRFVQKLDEAGKKRYRDYEIYPDRAMFQQQGKEEAKSVSDPLDDASFFFFVRTIPLVVGETYEFNRYFDPKSNPVIIRVLRREHLETRAGSFDAIVIQPIIKTGGLFSEGGEAELWLSDDNRRILLQMKVKLNVVGSLSLYLRTMRNTQDATKSSPNQP
jgi:hypothetical protein